MSRRLVASRFGDMIAIREMFAGTHKGASHLYYLIFASGPAPPRCSSARRKSRLDHRWAVRRTHPRSPSNWMGACPTVGHPIREHLYPCVRVRRHKGWGCRWRTPVGNGREQREARETRAEC
jgi:hypothetical protein